jgi:hypothetical protein
LAEWTGLEPATPGVTGRYSNQLNYHSPLKRRAFCHRDAVRARKLAAEGAIGWKPLDFAPRQAAIPVFRPTHEEAMSLQFINAPDLVGHWINGQADAGSG